MDVPSPVLLSEYQSPTFVIDSCHLEFQLDGQSTLVKNSMSIQMLSGEILALNGQVLELVSIELDGNLLSEDQYQVDADKLVISGLGKQCRLCIITNISPKQNTSLIGMYESSGNICTQCEAEGFRKITYYPDRPDVMTKFTVKIIADKSIYPVLLANGNLIEQVDLEDGKHFALWEDPFPKPCYLFALVAGDLAVLEDEFTTQSNRKVTLKIYSEPDNIDQCHHAMQAVKKAMRWDEENYGLEYDLDLFMIVAVNDFNFGAMENKGLNIFNTKYILAKPETATDQNYQDIDTVVAHEYFHNWSGNRVTLRDWFQLSLKEGLTVFREQSFDEDMQSPATLRIARVNQLRQRQFPEDAGPLAHSVRPESYIQIDNFYTMTIYNKGSEVIRMLKTLLGDTVYRQCMDTYFARYDGQAVTIEDMLAVMQEVSGIDLIVFKRWYSQAGTPLVTVVDHYDEASQQYTLSFIQAIPDTPGQKDKLPMVIPIRLALFDDAGKKVATGLANDVFVLEKAEDTLLIDNVASPVTPSLLRHFSAPIQLQFDYSKDQLIHLIQFDDDGFARWEAMQRFALAEMQRLMSMARKEKKLKVSDDFKYVFQSLLQESFEDKALQALLLTLPSETYIGEQETVVDVDIIHQARKRLKTVLSLSFKDEILSSYHELAANVDYQFDHHEVGKRSLQSLLLSYLTVADDMELNQLAFKQFKQGLGSNMTNCFAALSTLASVDCLERVEALSLFYDHYKHDALVMNKWLAVQASSALPDGIAMVKNHMQQDYFDLSNPNNVYALVSGFCSGNLVQFHAKDGAGYQFLADQVIALDKINPMVAANIVEPLTHWRRFDQDRQALMKAQLMRIIDTAQSKNVYECVSKSLQVEG